MPGHQNSGALFRLKTGFFVLISRMGMRNINFSVFLREVVKKKNGYFTVRLTVRVGPPPPYGQLICVFF